MKYDIEVDNTDFSIPQGTYVCRIIRADIGRAKQGPFENLDTLKTYFQITQGPHENKEFTYETPLQGKLKWLSKRTVKACIPTYGGGEFDTDDLIGKFVDVEIIPTLTKTGQPSRFPRVENVNFHVDPDDSATLADTMTTSQLDSIIEQPSFMDDVKL